MRALVFDTGPIISLATNNLLWILDRLKEKYNGLFYISDYVESELIKRPLEIKRFKFEALQVMYYVKKGTLRIINQKDIKDMTNLLLNLANNSYSAKDHYVQIVHAGEMETLATAMMLETDGIVIDERTTRMLVEEPERLAELMEKRLHTKITMNKENIRKFNDLTKKIKIMRSVELVLAAYELGWLDNYLPDMKNPTVELLDSVLWGLKLRGCSISRREMEQIIKLEAKR